MVKTLLKTTLTIFIALVFNSSMIAQSNDTLFIDAAKLNPKVIKEGVHQYLVYFKMGKEASRTRLQLWTRSVKKKKYNGVDAIQIEQVWENNDSIFHTASSISQLENMKPLYHSSWWKRRGLTTVDFIKNQVKIDGEPLGNNETDEKRKAAVESFKMAQKSEVFNWHIDLEFFPQLPYKKAAVFSIPFYEPGSASPPQNASYKVTGQSDLESFDGKKITCWLLYHEDENSKSTHWIDKKTKEVLKMEQEINGRMYRYKVKLGIKAG